MRPVKRLKKPVRGFSRVEPDELEMELEETRGVQNHSSQSGPRGSSSYAQGHHQHNLPIAAPTSFHNTNSGPSRKRPRIIDGLGEYSISSSTSNTISNSQGVSKSTTMIDLTGDHDTDQPGDDHRPGDANAGKHESTSFPNLADMRDSLPPTSQQPSVPKTLADLKPISLDSSSSEVDSDSTSSDTISGSPAVDSTSDADNMGPKKPEDDAPKPPERVNTGAVWDDTVETSSTTTFNGVRGRGFRHIFSDSPASDWIGKEWMWGGPPGGNTSATTSTTTSATTSATPLLPFFATNVSATNERYGTGQNGPTKRSGAAKAKKKGDFMKKNKNTGNVLTRPPKLPQYRTSSGNTSSTAFNASGSSKSNPWTKAAGASTSTTASAGPDTRFTGPWGMPTHSPTPGPSSTPIIRPHQPSRPTTPSELDDESLPHTPVEDMRSMSILDADDAEDDEEIRAALDTSMQTHAEEVAKHEQNFNMMCEHWDHIRMETEAGSLGENVGHAIASIADLELYVNNGLAAAANVGHEKGAELKMVIEKTKGRALELLEKRKMREQTRPQSNYATPPRVSGGTSTRQDNSQTVSPTTSNDKSENDVEGFGTPSKRKRGTQEVAKGSKGDSNTTKVIELD